MLPNPTTTVRGWLSLGAAGGATWGIIGFVQSIDLSGLQAIVGMVVVTWAVLAAIGAVVIAVVRAVNRAEDPPPFETLGEYLVGGAFVGLIAGALVTIWYVTVPLLIIISAMFHYSDWHNRIKKYRTQVPPSSTGPLSDEHADYLRAVDAQRRRAAGKK